MTKILTLTPQQKGDLELAITDHFIEDGIWVDGLEVGEVTEYSADSPPETPRYRAYFSYEDSKDKIRQDRIFFHALFNEGVTDFEEG